MLNKRIECDCCHCIIVDYAKKDQNPMQQILDDLFDVHEGGNKKDGKSALGYVEFNIVTLSGTVMRTNHLCEDCYNAMAEAVNKITEEGHAGEQ